MKGRAVMTVLSVLALSAVGLAYLLFGVIRIDPFSSPMTMTVNLAKTGGLLDYSEVTYRGIPIGRVTAIDLPPGGARAVIRVNEGVRIPTDTEVVVANLSPAGEQYLDFRPRTDQGPFLADGAVIDQRQTRLPVPFPQVVGNVTQLAMQVDPDNVRTLVGELAKGLRDTSQATQRTLDGTDYLLAGLEGVLPQTVGLLRNSQTVLGTFNDLRPEFRGFSQHARGATGALRDGDPALRDLLDEAPGALDLVDDVVRKDGPDVGELLGDLATFSQIAADRLPAMRQVLPGLIRVGKAAPSAVQGNQITALADLYPRPVCDYGTPRRLPTIGGSPPPRIYRYCTVDQPRLQQRGAQYAPRPRGDDTAGPPRGADLLERARPVKPSPQEERTTKPSPAPAPAAPPALPLLGGG
ncbi:MlaD family protein [Pseudonocardia eucalypti]|uniref:MlaD family protein n=1 Tax=Pseudonocardia eucalypti TaxID=648755 RepID=A0ABP9QE12_9PSEU|nr:virulence factor Mce-like protein [Pseudonocardia eucalypti]